MTSTSQPVSFTPITHTDSENLAEEAFNSFTKAATNNGTRKVENSTNALLRASSMGEPLIGKCIFSYLTPSLGASNPKDIERNIEAHEFVKSIRSLNKSSCNAFDPKLTQQANNDHEVLKLEKLGHRQLPPQLKVREIDKPAHFIDAAKKRSANQQLDLAFSDLIYASKAAANIENRYFDQSRRTLAAGCYDSRNQDTVNIFRVLSGIVEKAIDSKSKGAIRLALKTVDTIVENLHSTYSIYPDGLLAAGLSYHKLGIFAAQSGDVKTAKQARNSISNLLRLDKKYHGSDVERAEKWISSINTAVGEYQTPTQPDASA